MWLNFGTGMHHCRMPKYEVLVSLAPVKVLEMKSHGLILKKADEPIRMIVEETIMQRF
jgi:hypothetical protein